MMKALEVNGLKKSYRDFSLDVSFTLDEGSVTGFIGRNGAGKTTTLKSLFDFVHPDSGEIIFFEKPFKENELFVKESVGFVSGGANYYPAKKLKTVASVTSRFYPQWDSSLYEKYMKLFLLDEEKRISQLSAGMKVKFSLALALSHNARLLVLDEPTSGLDPVSRDELAEIFLTISQDEGKTVFFSTHITSDLQRCADRIIYLKNGRIAENSTIDEMLEKYSVINFSYDAAPKGIDLIGVRREKHGLSALVRTRDINTDFLFDISSASLDDIMQHFEHSEDGGVKNEKSSC